MTKELQFLRSELVRAISPARRTLARLRLRFFPPKPVGLDPAVLNGFAQASIKAGESFTMAAQEFVKLGQAAKSKFDFMDAIKYTQGPAPSSMYHHLEFTVGQMAMQVLPGMTIEARITDESLVSGPNATDMIGLDAFLRHEFPGSKFQLETFRDENTRCTVLCLRHVVVQPPVDPLMTNFGLTFHEDAFTGWGKDDATT